MLANHEVVTKVNLMVVGRLAGDKMVREHLRNVHGVNVPEDNNDDDDQVETMTTIK